MAECQRAGRPSGLLFSVGIFAGFPLSFCWDFSTIRHRLGTPIGTFLNGDVVYFVGVNLLMHFSLHLAAITPRSTTFRKVQKIL